MLMCQRQLYLLRRYSAQDEVSLIDRKVDGVDRALVAALDDDSMSLADDVLIVHEERSFRGFRCFGRCFWPI